jgi:phosphatidate cytidylyltransferase
MALSPGEATQPRFSGLWPRVVSALVLAAIAFVAVWFGFPWLDLLVGTATVLMVGEWRRMCGRWRHPFWLAAGLLYIAAAVLGFLWLRHDPTWGRETALWLIVVVSATDIGAYFTGKAVGGPRLAPRISPGKTWAGLGGGIGAAIVVAAIFAASIGGDTLAVALFALPVALVSQMGDLLESAVKRRFGFKDAGRLLPGHGGLLDRVDGLAAATLFVAVVKLLQAGHPPWT